MKPPSQSQLAKSTPEAQGIASSAILDFVNEAEQTIQDLHSFMVFRHGHNVAEGWWEPYQPSDPHIMFSLSKSFTSTAVGFAVAEGKLKVDDPVISFFPEATPKKVSANLAAMQLQHLLTMTTGHAADTMEPLFKHTQSSWVQTFLSLPVKYTPGTHFLYNTGASYMLSAIVQQVTGQTLLEYLQPRLFAPLGIENPSWESSPQGINTGGFGLNLTTADIARFGQLYLQQGVWQGTRLLPQSWIEAASSHQVPNGDPAEENDWTQGYGYQFWRCRHGAYRGDGAFGQFCVVMPQQDAVIAITAGVDNMQAVLNLIWKHLPGAMQPTPLPQNPAAQAELASKLASLQLPLTKGQLTTATAKRISSKRFVFEENKLGVRALSLSYDASGKWILSLEDKYGTHQLDTINAKWCKGTTTLDRGMVRHFGASGAWTSEDTYTLRLYYRTSFLNNSSALGVSLTPFGLTISCRFVKDKVILEQRADQSFISTKRPRLQGRLVD